LNRHERRAISKLFRARRSQFKAVSESRARAAEELAPAHAARAKKLRRLGTIGILFILALASLALGCCPTRRNVRSAAYDSCVARGASSESCSCYAEALEERTRGEREPSIHDVYLAVRECAGEPERAEADVP
jgi:hypothetical protein